MLPLVKFLISLSAWFPVAKVIELFKAAGELPNFADQAAVARWFERMGIISPLADVILAVIAQFAAQTSEVPEAIDQDDLAELVAAQNPGIDAATITLIIQAAMQILAMIRQWRQAKADPAPAPIPTPTPVV